MLITKFNKMIRSRLLWGFIAVVISVSFVLSFSSARSCSRIQNTGVGTLFGEAVTWPAYRTARFFEMRLRDNVNLSPEGERILHNRTWKRIATLQMADKLGLTSPQTEVGQVIRRDPAFQVNGGFSKERYRTVVRSQLGVDIGTFEQYIREDMTLRKIMSLMQALVWTSPDEADRRLRNLTDRRQVEFATLPLSALVTNVDIGMPEAEEFFAENQEAFTIPPSMQVKYVSFPATNYYSTNSVSATDVLDYYEDNMADYSTTDTNEQVVAVPLEEVRPEIVDILAAREALLQARDAATDMVVTLAPDRQGRAPTFEEAAARFAVSIHTSAVFSANEAISGISTGMEFTAAAFDLDPDDPEFSFSDALTGEHAVFIFSAIEKTEARIPELSEVLDDVMGHAYTNRQQSMFHEALSELRKEAEMEMAAGSTFSDAMAGLGHTVNTTGYFTVYSPDTTNDFEYVDAIIPGVVALDAGELSEPLPIEDGALLAYVADRQPGNPGNAEMLRPQVLGALNEYRSGVLMDTWGDYLLDVASFEDLNAPLAAADEQEDEENDDTGEGAAPLQELL